VSDEVLWSFTRSQADDLAGRKITDAEAERISCSIGNSTAVEAIGDVVFAVCSLPEYGDDDA
jgi:hypothetical protein